MYEEDEDSQDELIPDIILDPEPEQPTQRKHSSCLSDKQGLNTNYFSSPITIVNKATAPPPKSMHTRTTSVMDIEIDKYGSISSLLISSIEDKPWRKPGVDITDYFNYGFNETTWREYWKRQVSGVLSSLSYFSNK